MKKMKKLAGILLAMVMVVAMAGMALATEPDNGGITETGYTLTITGTKAGHTYNVYQIFTGDISGTAPNYVLSNVKYGQNYHPDQQVGAVVAESVLGGIIDADEFAKTVQVTDQPFKVAASVAENTVISALPAGYYLVKEEGSVTGQDAVTKFILQVVGDTSVAVKSDVPTVEKKVKENTKLVTGNTDTRIPGYTLKDKYNDVADYNIGDTVPFELIGTLPDNLADYTTYKYIFYDELSQGLTYGNNATVCVKIGDDLIPVTEGFAITSTPNNQTGGTTLTITATDIKDLKTNENVAISVTKDSYIVVDYTATLNTNAVIGLNGNENEVYLEFSNNPNQGGEGQTGTTPEDKVIVFTYELDTTKVDGADHKTKLEGAEFKLHNNDDKWVTVDENSKVTGWTDNEAEGSTLTSDKNGLFKVIGLDAGTYNLKETKAPTGYNLLANEITLEVIATTVNNQSWNSEASQALTALQIKVGETTANGDTNTGVVGTTVENNAGSTLPSTGGIGTTIFYVAGTILVLGAALVLITKKRMSAQK